jgi:DNA-binding MarR family transcriptional regulator
VNTTRWLDETETRAWRGYLQMRTMLDAELARDLARESGLSSADYEVLVHLSEIPGHRLRMNDLGARMLWSKSRLSHQVTRMEHRGLVARENCPSDARGSFVRVTTAGLDAIAAAAPAHVDNVRRHLLDLLSREQVEALGDISTLVVDHLTGCSAPHPLPPCTEE